MASPFTLQGEIRRLSCNPRAPEFYQNPYALYAHLHANSPTFFWEDYGHWCFAGWDDVNALFRDKRFGRQILHVATREELGWSPPLEHAKDFDAVEAHSLLSLEPPAHTKLRALVNRAFVSRQVENLRPKLEAMANDLIDAFESEGETDLINAFAAPLPVAIIAEMLGVPQDMAPQLLDWSHRMVAMYMYGRTKETELDANEAARAFADYVRTRVTEKRKSPGDDLISLMCQPDKNGNTLTEPEIISTAILLLNAGHEATVHQAGNGIKALLESGLDIPALFQDPLCTEPVIEECLRFDAPLHMFTRYALQDITLPGGIELKKGDEIGLMLAAANHDPTRFPDPGTFIPDRQNQANVSFGAGIHFCIGAPLARIELQTALKVLFNRLPNLRLAEPPQYANGYHFHGLEQLRVTW
jgi:cytochrome P450